MSGPVPQVPFADGVDVKELTKGDADPMFVTLQIGGVGESSRNTLPNGKPRKYPREVEEIAVSTINRDKSMGIRGHLSVEQRGHANPPSVWRAVGAMIDEQGRTFAKLYVFPNATDVRQEIQSAKATKAPIGLSRYAMGYVNEETGMVEADGYSLEGLDYVHHSRVGLMSASQVPHVTSETVAEVEPNAVSVGDFVSWGSSGGRATGRIERIERDGDVSIPGTDLTITGSPDDPAALIRLYRGSQPQDQRVGHKLSTLNKIAAPADEAAGTGEGSSKPYDKKETTMPDNPLPEGSQPSESKAIAELKQVNREAIEARDLRISELESFQKRYERLAEMLNVAEGDSPLVALQVQLSLLEQLKSENAELLRSEIELRVAEAIKLESVRPLVVEMVAEKSPATKAEVEVHLTEILARPSLKSVIKDGVAESMGPAQTGAVTAPSDAVNESSSNVDAATLVWSLT